MAEAIGQDVSLHISKTNIKIVVEHTGVSGSGHFQLSSRPEVLRFSASRSLVSIDGPVVVSIRGPNLPSKATTGVAAVVPADLTNWPADVIDCQRAPESVSTVTSLYLVQQALTLPVHPAINLQLKPEPLVGRVPAVVYAYTIAGGAAADKAVIEVSFTISLSGLDYVSVW